MTATRGAPRGRSRPWPEPRASRAPGEAPPAWRVALVEDHLLQRQRTEQILTEQPRLRVVCSCETLADFVAWLRRVHPTQRPQLLVLDLVADRRPDADPVVVETLIRRGLRVVVLSAMSSPTQVRAVVQAGVHAVVGKRDSEDDLLQAVWAALRGETWVTPELATVIAGDLDRPRLSGQEERALILYASGLTLDEVAEAIGVRPDTAKKYLSRVKGKYAEVGRPARTKLDLNRIAHADGYLSDGQGP